MPAAQRQDSLPCRHSLDPTKLDRAKTLLVQLASNNPSILTSAGISTDEWQPLLRMAVESMRGTFAASVGEKRRFTEAVLSHMQEVRVIAQWEFVGTRKRQDYRVSLLNGRQVAVESKGCGDGNNTGIWDRPRWAEEFVLWSQCPESLQHQPGDGVWSALATRIFPKVIFERVVVDCFIFFDGRCGSAIRRCPKNPAYGVEGNLRAASTEILGQDQRPWLPPPCLYLLPRSVPEPVENPQPPLHTLETCQFAAALLRAFNVPLEEASANAHWAQVNTQNRADGLYYQVTIGTDAAQPRAQFIGGWKRLRRD